MPVHYYCKKCGYTRKTNIVKSGFDLPKKNCPECNSILFGDGHNLNYKNTFNRELDCIDIRTCEEGVKLATQIIKEEYDALPIISSDKTYRWCFNPGKKLYEILKDVDNPEEYYGIEKYFETNDYKMILDYERVLLISDGLVNELYELSRDRQISINDIPIYKSQIFKNDRVYVDNYRINIDIPDLIKNDDSKDKSFYNLVRDFGKKQIYNNAKNELEFDIYDVDSLYEMKKKYHLFPRSHNIEYLIIVLKHLYLKHNYK